MIGYGLVVGLNNTGDTLNNSPFTRQSLQVMLERLGVNIRGSTLRTGNVAAVRQIFPSLGAGSGRAGLLRHEGHGHAVHAVAQSGWLRTVLEHVAQMAAAAAAMHLGACHQ